MTVNVKMFDHGHVLLPTQHKSISVSNKGTTLINVVIYSTAIQTPATRLIILVARPTSSEDDLLSSRSAVSSALVGRRAFALASLGAPNRLSAIRLEAPPVAPTGSKNEPF